MPRPIQKSRNKPKKKLSEKEKKKLFFSKLPKGIYNEEFTITIGEYCFTLLRGSKASNEVVEIDDREICKIYEDADLDPYEIFDRAKIEFMSFGSGKTRILNAYRSSSELGIWRLAYLRAYDCGLEKFNLDYVQGTLLHYKLQAFINEKWEDLITSARSGTSFDSYIGGLPKRGRASVSRSISSSKRQKIILDRLPSEKTTEIIDEKSRMEKEVPFSKLEITCADTGRYTIDDIHTHLVTLSGNIREGYEIDPETITFINEYYFIEPDELIDANIRIYTVIMRDISRVPPKDLKLVYCKYHLKYGAGENKTHVHGVYGIALLPVTEDENINEFGLSKIFKYAGAFVCKPLIYQIMCHPDSLDQSQPLLCNENYMYIGFIYSDIYPYNILGGLEHGGAESGNTGWFFDTKIQTDITDLLKSPSSVLSKKISLSLSGFTQHVTDLVSSGVRLAQTFGSRTAQAFGASSSKPKPPESNTSEWKSLLGGGRKTYKYKYNPVRKTRKFRN